MYNVLAVLEKFTNIHVKDSKGQTPLDIALKYYPENDEIIAILSNHTEIHV